MRTGKMVGNGGGGGKLKKMPLKSPGRGVGSRERISREMCASVPWGAGHWTLDTGHIKSYQSSLSLYYQLSSLSLSLSLSLVSLSSL